MKIYSKLFALCIFHPNVWEATAFVVQVPQRPTSLLKSTPSPAGGNAPKTTAGGPQLSSPPVGGAKGANLSSVDTQPIKNIWDSMSPIKVQGGSLRTWSIVNQNVKRVQVLMKTDGRPLNANVELWQGPDNTPHKMGIYVEDGNLRPFSAVIETPRGTNAVAIRNTGELEFPFDACVEAEIEDGSGRGSAGIMAATQKLADTTSPKIVQGGAVRTYPFAPSVASVQVLLMTDGRPMNVRIELLQGPNNIKQNMEVYTEDGTERPFFAVIETPGSGNVIRICNTATVEYPLTARVEPYVVETARDLSVSDDPSSFFVLT